MKITLRFGDHYDAVLVDGTVLDPARSLAVVNHSPSGFAWGYGGSGPAQLALALLLEAGVDEHNAQILHQDFKFEFVAGWPQSDFEVDINPFAWARENPRYIPEYAEDVDRIDSLVTREGAEWASGDIDGYDPGDPKSPGFHDRMTD